MRILILFISLMFSGIANAEYLGFEVDKESFFTIESVSVVSGLYVKHISSTAFRHNNIKKKYNETNDYWALKLRTQSGYEFSFGRFNNSYYVESYGLGIHKDLYKFNNYVSLGAELLLTSGYQKFQDHLNTYIIAVPSLYMGIDVNAFSVKMSLISGMVLGVSAEYRFYIR